jgi:hypothetical protein
MNFWRFSLIVATSFFNSTSFSKISSTTYAIRVMSFSSLSCVALFTIPCAATNSPMTMSASSYRGTNHCARVFCSSLICSISFYDCIFTEMVVMHSDCCGVLIFSVAFCAFSCEFLNVSSMTTIVGSLVNFFQRCVLYFHKFMHSSSRLLIFSTEVMVFLSLSSFSSGGVPGIVCTLNSLILVWKP